jgi:hypothetical protein
MRIKIVCIFYLISCVFSLGETAVSSSVTVPNALVLNITLNSITFQSINYSNYNVSDPMIIHAPTQAYTTASNSIHLSMSSNTPSTSNGDPQLSDGRGNYIPYTVTYTPCVPPSTAPMAPISLSTNTSSLVPTPYSTSRACLNPPLGGGPGSLDFTRSALVSLPNQGTYTNILTFTVSEP